jgi:hypothetical protein
MHGKRDFKKSAFDKFSDITMLDLKFLTLRYSFLAEGDKILLENQEEQADVRLPQLEQLCNQTP